jgi:membrane-associated phospholipid phosphatase
MLSKILVLYFAITSTIFFDNIACAQLNQSVTKSALDTSITRNKEDQNQYFKTGSLIVPGTFMLYVALKPAVSGIRHLDNNIMASVEKKYSNFHTNAADYIMWTPSASIYALDVFKVKTQHNFREHIILDAGSIIITGGIGYVMREIARQIKAYNTKGTEFPSGHTANAFRGAEIVHQELKKSHPVWSYSGYVIAASVGLLRIYDKDHLLTEVLAGASLGILSTKLTYWIFDKVKYSKKGKLVNIN